MAPTGAPELEPDEPPPTLDAEVAVEVEDSVVDSPVEEDDVVVSDAEVVVDESEVVFSIVSSVVSEVVLEIKLNGVASSSNSRVLLCLSQSHAETVEPLVENNQVMQYGSADPQQRVCDAVPQTLVAS